MPRPVCSELFGGRIPRTGPLLRMTPWSRPTDSTAPANRPACSAVPDECTLPISTPSPTTVRASCAGVRPGPSDCVEMLADAALESATSTVAAQAHTRPARLLPLHLGRRPRGREAIRPSVLTMSPCPPPGQQLSRGGVDRREDDWHHTVSLPRFPCDPPPGLVSWSRSPWNRGRSSASYKAPAQLGGCPRDQPSYRVSSGRDSSYARLAPRAPGLAGSRGGDRQRRTVGGPRS